ncbi:hypothetical protein VNO78_03128 [Psophocarpus tetragonolobus]|uniref:Uncharacterized protein n=1 Tax=Psophocarpus tetragonolobus TaxID=3891 RepID=A0AAN9XVP0_PSOTE
MKSHRYLEDGEDLVMVDLNDLDACQMLKKLEGICQAVVCNVLGKGTVGEEIFELARVRAWHWLGAGVKGFSYTYRDRIINPPKCL